MRWLWPIAVLSLLSAVMVAPRLNDLRPQEARAHILYVPSGGYLKHATVGFQALTSDLLYIWSIQYASDRAIKGQHRYLPRVFDAITDLDPWFDEAYSMGAYILAMDAREPDRALELLDKGFRVQRDYMFPYDAGFYCFLVFQDYERAGEYFRRAAEQPECPIYVRRLALKMAALVNPHDAYDLYVRDLREFSKENSPADIERDRDKSTHLRIMRNRIRELEASIETEELNRLADVVKERTGQAPRSLPELIRELSELGLHPKPLHPGAEPFRDPLGEPYEYRDGGFVRGTSIKKRRR